MCRKRLHRPLSLYVILREMLEIVWSSLDENNVYKAAIDWVLEFSQIIHENFIIVM